MKLLLIASWITGMCGQFTGYPAAREMGHNSAPQTSSQALPGSSSGSQFSGYPNHRERDQNQNSNGGGSGYPAHRERDQNQNSNGGGSGYPAHRERDQEQNSNGGGSGYPAHRERDQEQNSNGGSSGGQFGGYQDNSAQQNNFKPDNQQEKMNNGSPDDEPKSQMQIQKHIYFHSAPPDPEVPNQKRPMGGGTRQKHYTIIFIDTSRLAGSPRQQQSVAAPQNEEKTIVYVLVKKPGEQADSSAPMTPITPPSKPEVFFIKYKEQRESKPKQEQKGDAPYPAKMDPPSGPKLRRQIYHR